MNLTVTGHHVDVTEAMRRHVETKLGKLARHTDLPLSMAVTLVVEKDRHKAEAKVHAADTHLHADATENDMYAAIDALADKLDRQLIRHKEKRRTLRHDAQQQLPEETEVG